MRAIIIILLVSCMVKTSLSQSPSKEAMQAQVKQAKMQAQQEIKLLEDQIAQAKKKGDDVESIREMEKNLATMKQMMGVMGRASTIQERRPVQPDGASVTVKPYQSPYIRFFNQKVVAPTKAQAKDKLLWYRGRKINQNTLVTPQGRVIRYERQNNRVVVQLNDTRDTVPLKIISNLKKSRQWTNTYVNNKSAEKNSFFEYPMVMLVMKEYELIEKEFDRIANNTIKLPGVGTNLHASVYFDSPENRSGPSADYDFNSTDSTDPYIQQLYEDIMSRMNNPPPMDCPVPPKQEFGLCFYCNPDALEQYDREKQIWGDALHEYEVGIISRCLTIERYFAILGTEAEKEMGPAEYANLQRAQQFAMDRMDQRIKLLQQRYGNDIYRYTCVISATLGEERQKALLGCQEDGFPSASFDILTNRIFEDFMEQRIAANDYDVMFNYALILGFARQRALLGAGDDKDLDNIINDVVNHNRFALTVQMNFKIQFGPDDKPVIIADGDLSTAQKVYVKLGRTQDCKWQFYLYTPDYGLEAMRTQEIIFKIPITVNGGIKKIKTDKGWETFSYSGPTETSMNFPSFRISFCNSGQDSAIMDVLRYEMEDISGYKMGKPYNIDLLEYVNKMLISVTDTKANASGLVSMADEMMNLSSQRTVDNPTGYAKLDEMQVKFKMNGKQEDLKKRSLGLDRVPNTVMLFDAQNGSCYLINNSTQSPNQEFSIDLKTAVIKIKVVCEPL